MPGADVVLDDANAVLDGDEPALDNALEEENAAGFEGGGTVDAVAVVPVAD
jgi:hypothetical protein